MNTPSPAPPFWQLALALAIVYVVWGSTYLAIRVVVHEMPPFLMAGSRFLIAAGLMFAIGLAMRHSWPQRREALGAMTVGLFLLLGGNGCVVWAEQFISSGMAALLVAALPLCILLLELVLPGGERPSKLAVGGILMGFLGVVALFWPSLSSGAQSAFWAQGLVLLGTFLWASGTLIGRRVAVPKSGVLNSGFTMLGGGLGLAVAALVTGEFGRLNLAAVSTAAWLWFAYLVLFGSLIAFSAFTWLVQNARPDLTSTYAYVNPVVAVALGVAILKEPLDVWTVVGATLVVASVAIVIQGSKPKAPPASAPAPQQDEKPMVSS